MAVFTGILDIARSPDELAVLLGHEMAHTILRHQVSSCVMCNFYVVCYL